MKRLPEQLLALKHLHYLNMSGNEHSIKQDAIDNKKKISILTNINSKILLLEPNSFIRSVTPFIILAAALPL